MCAKDKVTSFEMEYAFFLNVVSVLFRLPKYNLGFKITKSDFDDYPYTFSDFFFRNGSFLK